MRTKKNLVERQLLDQLCYGSYSFYHRQLKIDIANRCKTGELVWLICG
jgi:hypothetical protein